MSNVRDNIQNKAIQTIIHYDNVGISVSMGVGKTLIGLRYLEYAYTDSLTVLIVAPKKAIFQSWKDEAVKFGLEHLIPHMHFSTYLSLTKQDTDYDVVILDECHNLLESHEEYLDDISSKIIGLTGTPPRDERSEKAERIEAYCPIMFEYKVDDAIHDGILNGYTINVHLLPLDSRRNLAKKSKAGKVFYSSEYADYNYWSERLLTCNPGAEYKLRIMRMKAMMTYKSKEVFAKKLFNSIQDKCILFANTQEQADQLCAHSYHSENKDSEINLKNFKDGTINKLSCVLQLSEGVNIPNLKEGIIMHAYGNERKSAQRIGRLLRLNPNDSATVHILCYDDTIDVKWVQSALVDFTGKVNYIKH